MQIFVPGVIGLTLLFAIAPFEPLGTLVVRDPASRVSRVWRVKNESRSARGALRGFMAYYSRGATTPRYALISFFLSATTTALVIDFALSLSFALRI